MHIYLKIKIKSLAAEATMIHREERRQNPGHRARVRARRFLDEKTRINKAVDARSLTISQAKRALRKPSETTLKTFWGLRHHRQYDVRSESRASHVAYGFLRGLDYKQIEGTAKSSPNWSRVEDLVKKYGEDDIRLRMQRFEEWRQEAEKLGFTLSRSATIHDSRPQHRVLLSSSAR